MSPPKIVTTPIQERAGMEIFCTRNTSHGVRRRLLTLPPSQISSSWVHDLDRACERPDNHRSVRCLGASCAGDASVHWGGVDRSREGYRSPWMKSDPFRHRPGALWPPSQTCPAGIDGLPTQPLGPA